MPWIADRGELLSPSTLFETALSFLVLHIPPKLDQEFLRTPIFAGITGMYYYSELHMQSVYSNSSSHDCVISA